MNKCINSGADDINYCKKTAVEIEGELWDICEMCDVKERYVPPQMLLGKAQSRLAKAMALLEEIETQYNCQHDDLLADAIAKIKTLRGVK